MTSMKKMAGTSRKPLRIWPGLTAAVLLWLVWFGLPAVAPDAGFAAVLTGVGLSLAILLWWLFWSRAPWSERLSVVAILVVAGFVTSKLVHESLAGAAMGMLVYIFMVPVLATALVVWAVLSQGLVGSQRFAALAATLAVACGLLLALRLDGISNRGSAEWHWRWTPTAEQRLLAQLEDEPPLPPAAPALAAESRAPGGDDGAGTMADEASAAGVVAAGDEAMEDGAGDPSSTGASGDGNAMATGNAGGAAIGGGAGDAAAGADSASGSAATTATIAVSAATWPGFRGPGRDGVVHGPRIAADWEKEPPVALWRRPVGPGWSSFAVDGDRFYTQEQLGDDEVVSCYRLATGEPVWRHKDPVRFWEANAGAGPRGTPTLERGRVYTLGATGLLNALDAGNGSVVWSRDAAADTGVEVPYWGFSGSPLVVGDEVVVAVGGTLAAYDLATGEPRWQGPKQSCCYSSPHLATLGGRPQILLTSDQGAISVAPEDGAVLWRHEWKSDGIVQPAVTDDGDVLLGSGSGMNPTGLRRLAVAPGDGEWSPERGASGWSTQERWTTNGLKPYFNGFVVHRGHAYGFDGGILASVDLATGERKWKGGRYGDGQMVLLADQDLLLVLSEKGEVVLVEATPEAFRERARFKVIDGKTWNHPALAGDVVLVRNSEEMAAVRLPLAGG